MPSTTGDLDEWNPLNSALETTGLFFRRVDFGNSSEGVEKWASHEIPPTVPPVWGASSDKA